MRNVVVGRQPIFDAQLGTYAYELLFRDAEEPEKTRVRVRDGDAATSSVILSVLADIGLDRVVDTHPAHINVTRAFVLGKYALPEPAERIVLEVQGDVRPEPEILDALRGLIARGYRIALDDFLYDEKSRPLVELAHMVKLDFVEIGSWRMKSEVEALRRFGVKLVAVKLSTRDEFDQARALGFDYFQGFFLARPRLIQGKRPPHNHQVLVHLLARIYDPNVTVGEVESLVAQDVTLSFRVLRVANSVLLSRGNPVDSLRQAIMRLGFQQLAAWVALIGLADISDKPHELLVTALVRAKMCELIGRHLDMPMPDQLFTTGLFSVLDAVFDMPMRDILASMPLADEITRALIEQAGPAGAVLRCVMAYERGDWGTVAELGLGGYELTRAWLAAVEWARQAQEALARK